MVYPTKLPMYPTLRSNFSQGGLGSGSFDTLGNYGSIPGFEPGYQNPGTDFSGFNTPNQVGLNNDLGSANDYATAFANQPTGLSGMWDSFKTGFKDLIPGGALGSFDPKTGIKTEGWAGPAVGVATGLMNGFLGMQQYGLAKDAFEQSKSQFNQNFDANRGITNGRLADRQARRVKEDPNATSVADYMAKYGVK